MRSKSKVLMIDDAKMMHAVVKARLAEDDVEFYSAFGGEEGVKVAMEVLPDVILLDVEMPEVNGFEVCRRLKTHADISHVPIIFLTAASSTEEKVKGLNLGAIDYMTKPFDSAELQARVRASLRTKELVDMLAQRAMIDGLTGLRNRAYFNDRLVEELARAGRNRSPLSCLMLDIDHFKSVNDTHGHGFGDLVLRGVGQILNDSSRMDDVVCRYGGEEFVILTPGVAATGAQVLAERIRAQLQEQSFARGGVKLNVTCSVGISDRAGDTLVESADAALYQAKSLGRNCVHVTAGVAKAA